MIQKCKSCGVDLPLHTGQHRPRKFCVTCRPPRVKRAAAEAPSGPRPAVVAPPLPLRAVPTSLEAVTHALLVERGVRSTAGGVQAMMLAVTLDSGGHSASGLAALSREYTRVLAAAVAPVSVEDEDEGDGGVWDVG